MYKKKCNSLNPLLSQFYLRGGSRCQTLKSPGLKHCECVGVFYTCALTCCLSCEHTNTVLVNTPNACQWLRGEVLICGTAANYLSDRLHITLRVSFIISYEQNKTISKWEQREGTKKTKALSTSERKERQTQNERKERQTEYLKPSGRTFSDLYKI